MKSNCIIWDGPLWSQGRYGMDKINGKSMGAHRAAFIKAFGNIPKGMVVCHKCDNGLCVNVDHLFLGTMKDNMQDCKKKGRISNGNQKGEKNNNAKPNFESRNKEVKKDRANGMTFSNIRKKHGIKSNGHLVNILKS